MKNTENLNNEILPWMQQPGEKNSDYFRFAKYLDLKEDRSYVNVANIYGVTLRTISEIGRKNNWVKRARQFDKYINYHYSHKYSYDYNNIARKHQAHTLEVVEATYKAEKIIIDYLNNHDLLFRNDLAIEKLNYFEKVGKVLNYMRRMRKIELPDEFRQEASLLSERINDILKEEPEDFESDNPYDVLLDQNPEEELKLYGEIPGPEEGEVAYVFRKNESEKSQNTEMEKSTLQTDEAVNIELNDKIEDRKPLTMTENVLKNSIDSGTSPVSSSDSLPDKSIGKMNQAKSTFQVQEIEDTGEATVEIPDADVSARPRPNVKGLFYEPALDPESEEYDPYLSEDDFDRGDIYNKIRIIDYEDSSYTARPRKCDNDKYKKKKAIV